ncbi:nitrogenase iron-molybdenum cofactor biosynthesis protein NifN [Vibrio hippocampi]|uniref:Nitrogenase iron-molybdenum cofactor biosynthesis protein NifN n=1 Tax=Vibrio hippocampi TaxID=654686 RepID=A0ABM8ZLG4_9VIBR|nr:nitrogenase iron-molybdenum cofactor biosynthesis protein NifN [Vibrio hippocampi]CAH0529271.1 Nitrogenase molybdenum-iron protein beta chain [Vibrio hippocampi]
MSKFITSKDLTNKDRTNKELANKGLANKKLTKKPVISHVTNHQNALVTKPLKTSQSTGAALATMGFAGSIPLIHGSQGCSAFSKVYLISHFREPFPIQNSAIDQVAAVMGSEENLIVALNNLCEKHQPQCIAVLTTGLTEMQGSDIWLTIKNFKRDFPQHAQIEVVPVSTPDFKGSMESGFAAMVSAVVKQCADPMPTKILKQQVNVLCSVTTTPADIELISRYLEAFGLEGLFLPDISQSLDGHLQSDDLSQTSTGGTTIEQLATVSASGLTLCLGESMLPLAKWLNQRFAIPMLSLSMGLESCDELIHHLTIYSKKPVPKWIERSRQRLLDAMLDSHFVLSDAHYGVAAESDQAAGFSRLLQEIGAGYVHMVTTKQGAWCADTPFQVVIGDMAELDQEYHHLDLVLGNSHLADFVPHDLAHMRIGFPCYDQFGNSDRLYLGYEGARACLFEMANLCLRHHKEEVTPHVSRYAFSAQEVVWNGRA